MTRLIQALLDLSRVLTKKKWLEEVDLGGVVQEVVSDLELKIEKAGGRVDVGPLPTIRADRSHMYQLFQNCMNKQT